MLTKTEFLTKYKGVTITCPTCKNDFKDDRNKVSIGKMGMCMSCNIKSMRFKSSPLEEEKIENHLEHNKHMNQMTKHLENNLQ